MAIKQYKVWFVEKLRIFIIAKLLVTMSFLALLLIDLRSAYVTQFLIQTTSGMHSALWDTFGSITHCLKIV
jgi:hypothetical protein